MPQVEVNCGIFWGQWDGRIMHVFLLLSLLRILTLEAHSKPRLLSLPRSFSDASLTFW